MYYLCPATQQLIDTCTRRDVRDVWILTDDGAVDIPASSLPIAERAHGLAFGLIADLADNLAIVYGLDRDEAETILRTRPGLPQAVPGAAEQDQPVVAALRETAAGILAAATHGGR